MKAEEIDTVRQSGSDGGSKCGVNGWRNKGSEEGAAAQHRRKNSKVAWRSGGTPKAAWHVYQVKRKMTGSRYGDGDIGQREKR